MDETKKLLYLGVCVCERVQSHADLNENLLLLPHTMEIMVPSSLFSCPETVTEPVELKSR